MKRRKRGVFQSILLAAVLALGGCGAEGGGEDAGSREGRANPQLAVEAKNYVYKEEEIIFDGLTACEASCIVFSEGKFIVNGTKYSDAGNHSFYTVFDGSGRRLSHYETDEAAGETDGSFVVGTNGDIYAIMTKEIVRGSGENITYKMCQYLVRRNPDGTEKERVSLSERNSTEEYFYATKIIADKKGGLIVAANGAILLFDEEKGFVKLIRFSEEINEALPGREGQVILIAYTGNEVVLRRLETATGQIGEKYTLPQSMGYRFFAGTEYDLLLTTDKAVYGYNLGDAEPAKLMDYEDSDLDAYILYELIPAEGGSFYAKYISTGDGTSHFSKFTGTVPEDGKACANAVISNGKPAVRSASRLAVTVFFP